MRKRLNGFAGACLSAALLAACGGSNGLSPSAPFAIGHSALGHHGSHRVKPASWAESVLHSFAGGSDGSDPDGDLTLETRRFMA